MKHFMQLTGLPSCYSGSAHSRKCSSEETVLCQEADS